MRPRAYREPHLLAGKAASAPCTPRGLGAPASPSPHTAGAMHRTGGDGDDRGRGGATLQRLLYVGLALLAVLALALFGTVGLQPPSLSTAGQGRRPTSTFSDVKWRTLMAPVPRPAAPRTDGADRPACGSGTTPGASGSSGCAAASGEFDEHDEQADEAEKAPEGSGSDDASPQEPVSVNSQEGRLPMMSANKGPWMESWKNSIAICVVMKEENPLDVREWMLYHRWVGVDKIILFEHYTDSPLSQEASLKELIDSDFVDYKQVDTEGQQRNLYSTCHEQYREQFNWIAYIDADEYIALRETGKGKLKEFLDDYKHYTGLSVSWIFMGWNDRKTRPAAGGVLRYYTQCRDHPSRILKTIVNSFYTAGGGQVHSFLSRGFVAPVNEKGLPVPYKCSQTSKKDWKKKPECQLKAASTIPRVKGLIPTVDRIYLAHYYSKSLEDYQVKMAKGLASGHNARTMEHFDRMAIQRQVSGGICKELSKVAEDCCPEWPVADGSSEQLQDGSSGRSPASKPKKTSKSDTDR